MNFAEKLKYLIENIKVDDIKQTAYQIGKNTSISRQSIENYLSDKQKPSSKNATIIAQYFNIPLSWLLNDKMDVSMLKTQQPSAPTLSKTSNDIKILDIRVCAGHGIGFEGSENKVIGYVNIPDFTGCVGITVYGDSMYDKYAPGDTIFVREITDKTLIENGQTYVIITREDRLLKQMYVEDDKITLTSYNAALNPDGRRKYPDMNIKGDQIIKLYKVVGVLGRTQM